MDQARIEITVKRHPEIIDEVFDKGGFQAGVLKHWLRGQQMLIYNTIRSGLREYIIDREDNSFKAVEFGQPVHIQEQKKIIERFLNSEPVVVRQLKQNLAGKMLHAAGYDSGIEFLARVGIEISIKLYGC